MPCVLNLHFSDKTHNGLVCVRLDYALGYAIFQFSSSYLILPFILISFGSVIQTFILVKDMIFLT